MLMLTEITLHDVRKTHRASCIDLVKAMRSSSEKRGEGNYLQSGSASDALCLWIDEFYRG
jgi:hypothetical protein